MVKGGEKGVAVDWRAHVNTSPNTTTINFSTSGATFKLTRNMTQGTEETLTHKRIHTLAYTEFWGVGSCYTISVSIEIIIPLVLHKTHIYSQMQTF